MTTVRRSHASREHKGGGRRAALPPSALDSLGRASKGKRALAVLALLLGTYIAFEGVLRCGFIELDDASYITANEELKMGLSPEGIRWAFTTAQTHQWHPIAWLSHLLDYEIYGLNPRGHHRSSLFIQMACCILAFLLLENATGRFWPSLLAASLFGLHPLRVESVAWAAERRDLLCAFFYLLTLWAYTRFARRPSPMAYLAALVCFSLALMSKPMAITLPAALLLMDFWPLARTPWTLAAPAGTISPPASPRRVGWARLLIEKVPFIAMALSVAIVQIRVAGSGAVSSLSDIPLGMRFQVALDSYFRYLLMLLWPHNLAIQYPYPSRAIPLFELLLAVAALAAVSAVAIRTRRTQPYISMGWGWYLATLIPVIGLVQAGKQARADRFTFIPSFGLCVLLAWGMVELARRFPRARRPILTLSILVPLALIPATRRQVEFWQNPETLFRRAIAVSEENHAALYGLGWTLANQGRLEEAEIMLRRAVALYHDPEYLNELGVTLGKMGRLDDALTTLRSALALRPGDTSCANNLGIVLARQGHMDEARTMFAAVLAARPEDAQAMVNLGNIATMEGRRVEAEEWYRKALLARPGLPGALAGLERLNSSASTSR